MNKIYCQRFACVETTLLRLHTASPNIIYHYNNKFKFKFCFFLLWKKWFLIYGVWNDMYNVMRNGCRTILYYSHFFEENKKLNLNFLSISTLWFFKKTFFQDSSFRFNMFGIILLHNNTFVHHWIIIIIV